jgi:hypothetical protein
MQVEGGGTYSKFLQVVQDELSTGGLHDPSPVGGGVVGGSLSEGDTLSHLGGGQRGSVICQSVLCGF